MSTNHRVTLSARRLPIALAVTALVLVACHVATWCLFYETDLLDPYGHWVAMLDLDTEASLGTWFSCSILLLAGILTLLHGKRGRAAGDRGTRWWRILGIGLLFLSLDEVAAIHEAMNSDPWFTAHVGHWTVVGAALVAVLGLAFLPFLWRLPLRPRVLFIVAAVVYVAGAVGVEFATLGYEESGTLNTLAYNLWNAVEEGLEMAGVILYLGALLPLMAGAGSDRVEAGVDVRP